ncbi:Adenylyl cyclase class-3/4/guanylyl cyclase domain and Heme-NO binding domain and Haem NO binding associated domain and NO signalling/Golgi transport ligand-binding domain-containing protein [Strongyloides ratti]|uniref:guanylate cyclase n=1 Tax=Strongyloides ratti TaxID=34506 RepID=A0A090LJG0_STRRB|nr:Adenylyl cyclase class-3/4/guanylyl cyclase domain and Heme-NO binding domain and Haem NO binding associated domain and NO signalling/Golgi transport ligand-binding domain-containing protein [Strongyloides ratti]CEF69838.1 Adenylyl cyclase class-3/4/guanylyl cyclase domain and Heme-NO binding domain and Haem NO binding associated domain and NO signalling/Golgi transport ligand-binding domain-containing protein [Strongyloides ratti]
MIKINYSKINGLLRVTGPEVMFGWIHESFRQLVYRKYGRDVWLKILEIIKFEEGSECEISHYYKDEDTMKIVNAMANVIGIPIEEVWEAYGGFLIQFTMETGWDELLKALSDNLEGFLDSLDSLHYFIDHVVYRTKLKGPSFRCEPAKNGSLILHYYSKRSGLYPIVKGVVREVARRIFNTEVIMKVQERKQEHLDTYITEHVIFSITMVENENSGNNIKSLSEKSNKQKEIVIPKSGYNLTVKDFVNAFPHHLCFDKNLILQHVGSYLIQNLSNLKIGFTTLTDIVDLVHPELPLTFESLIAFKNSLFVFKIKNKGLNNQDDTTTVELKGSMVHLEDQNYILYLCSLSVTTVREMIINNLYLSDMQKHDGTRDLIMLNQSRMSQVELNRKLEETTKNLKRMAMDLEIETQKTDELLCQLMPSTVAESLRQGRNIEAAEFLEATCLFTDIVTFTNICALCSPYDVVNLLNDMYLRFDRLVTLHDVYKVETIGDAYVIVGGVPKICENHAERVLNCSIGMLMESRAVISPLAHLVNNKKMLEDNSIKIRIGIHTGPVVAGVVGAKMPKYCLFGDAVNTASKMESNGVPLRIHVSDPSKNHALKTNPSFEFETRGIVNLKEKGEVLTHFLIKNGRKSVWELTGKQKGKESSIDGYTELQQAYEDYKNSLALTIKLNNLRNGNENDVKKPKNKSTFCSLM